MEEFLGQQFDGIKNTVRKKRTQTSRRPRPESHTIPKNHDFSTSSSTPPSDDVSKVSSDENSMHGPSSRRKEFNLNQCMSIAHASEVEGEKADEETTGLGGGLNAPHGDGGSSERKRCSEGVLAPANWKSTSKLMNGSESPSISIDICGRIDEHQSSAQRGMNFDGLESKVKKMKLKVGGITRTIEANSTTNGAICDGSSSKNSHQRRRPKFKDNSDDNKSPPNKKSGLQGIPWKDFLVGFNLKKGDSLMGNIRPRDKSETLRKSKRVPKRRIRDGAFENDDEDDEIRYLEKLKSAKLVSSYKEDEQESSRKHRSVSKISKNEENLKRLVKDNKKPSPNGISKDADYEEEDDQASDCELEGKKRKPRKESIQTLMEGKKEMALTTRQRALQLGKDASATNQIEFPNGLPPCPSRRQKEKLTDVEQQLKKAEAAQRRRMQVEKAARESEAEAIRKILGQDSSRKKREDKLKKRREELAQEKAASALVLASNTIRWVMGPSGTTVTFPNDMGLPSIFDSKPRSYPPPRENCAGPCCTNPYKYRDSKSKLPLCSLQCYKAIREKIPVETSS